MDIRIYDPPEEGAPTFRTAGRLTLATSIETVERWTGVGNFTVEVPFAARHAQALRAGRVVEIGGFWGIIDDLKISAASSGVALTVSGRQLKGLCQDRITIPPAWNSVTGAQGYDTANGTTEAVMKHFVRANLGDGAAEDRRLVGLVIAADRGRGLAGDKYMSRHEVLSDVLSQLGAASALGWDLTPDLGTHAFVFDVCPGEDHTAGQSQRKRVVFDVERKTALTQDYAHSAGDGRNLFYTTLDGSEFADEALTVTYVREGEAAPRGIWRREQHLSISVSTPAAGSEYDELRRQALIRAEEYRAAESFSCSLAQAPLEYGADWHLGDLVTVRNSGWGVSMDARVTEARRSWSSAGLSISATFGTAPLNVFGKLRRQIREG